MEIFLYGQIDKYTAEYLSGRLKMDTGATTLKINSPGGDVFAALSISNAIREHGNVTTSIDGLCASAAVMVAIAGKRVCMASNGLIMLHAPSTLLIDFVNKEQLAQMQTTLEKIEESILATYRQRIPNFQMPSGETWLNAAQAKDMGLIDEITGAVQVEMKNNLLFMNSLTVDMNRFDVGRLTLAMSKPDSTLQSREEIIREVRAEELKRIKALQRLKTSNSAVNALVDVAIESGQSAAEILPYVEAVAKVKTIAFRDILSDQMASGADGVNGSSPAPDSKAAQINRIVECANRQFDKHFDQSRK